MHTDLSLFHCPHLGSNHQAKAQFSFWAIMSSPLLIAADPGQVHNRFHRSHNRFHRSHTRTFPPVPHAIPSRSFPMPVPPLTLHSLSSVVSLLPPAPAQVEPELIEYWGNEEIIEVSQTFRKGGPYQGARLVGDDVSFDPKTNTGKGTNVWGKVSVVI
jgi:hypothetical protein